MTCAFDARLIHRPDNDTIAGSNRARIMVASRIRPAPKPVATILIGVLGAVLIDRKAKNMISAALVTSRPVRAIPITTALLIGAPAKDSSRMRDTINTP